MERTELGRRLTAARVAAKRTQAEVALIVGVHEITILRWEQGRYEPSLEYLQTLADLYRVRVSRLIPKRRCA